MSAWLGEFRYAPDTSDEQLGMALNVAGFNLDVFKAEVCEGGLIYGVLVVELDGHFVDDLVASLFLDGGFDEFALVAVDEVLGENAFDHLDAALNGGFLIGGTVLGVLSRGRDCAGRKLQI